MSYARDPNGEVVSYYWVHYWGCTLPENDPLRKLWEGFGSKDWITGPFLHRDWAVSDAAMLPRYARIIRSKTRPKV